MCEHVRRTVPDSYYYGDPELRRRILSQCENLNKGPLPRLLSPDFSLAKWPATRVRRRLKRTITCSGSTAGKGQRSSVPSTWKDCLVASKLMSSESKSAVEEGECSAGNKMSEDEVTTAQCAQRTSLAQLYVNGLSSETFSLEVLPEEEASAVYQAVEQHTGIPISDQLLMFHGHKVLPLLSLDDQGITVGSTLRLSLALRGGADDPPSDGFDDRTQGRMARQIGKDWRKVGRELGISNKKLMKIKDEEDDNEERCVRMLQMWLDKPSTHHDRMQELLTALRQVGRMDVVEDFGFLFPPQVGPSKTGVSVTQTATQNVESQQPRAFGQHTLDEGVEAESAKSRNACETSEQASGEPSLSSAEMVPGSSSVDKATLNESGALISSGEDNDLSGLEDAIKKVNRNDYDKLLLVNGMSPNGTGHSTQMAFLLKIDWNAIFDFDPDCEHDRFNRTITNSASSVHFEKMSAGNYLSKNSISQPAQLGLGTKKRPWVFVNEKKDGETKAFMNSRKQDCIPLVDALQNYDKCCQALATVVVLSSEQDLEHMAFVMEQLVIRGFTNSPVRPLTVITISKELRDKLLTFASWVHTELSAHCFVVSVDDMSRIFTRVSEHSTAAQSTRPKLLHLPQSDGHGVVGVPQNVVDQWVGLEVLSSYQCENEEFTESQKNDVAIDFYKGHKVTWWNFYYEHDVTRSQCNEFVHKLRSQAAEVEKLANSETKSFHAIRIVKITYECGTGGTTMARRLLWELRCDYRCAVVQSDLKKICKSIASFQHCKEHAVKKPVIILVDRERWLWLRGLVEGLRDLKVRCVILFVEAEQDEESVSRQEHEKLEVDEEDLIQNEVPVLKPKLDRKEQDEGKIGSLEKQEGLVQKELVLKLEPKLDKKERGFVKSKIESLEGHEKRSKAVQAVENAGLFIYVGLELFGQQYNQKRLAEFVEDRLSPTRREVTDRHRRMLEFCSLLYLYIHESFPKERFNMYVLGLDSFCQKIVRSPVADLLVEYEDKSTSFVCYRPAHICVAELILSKRPLKNICLDFVRYLPDNDKHTVQHLWSLIPSLFIIRASTVSNNFGGDNSDLEQGEAHPPTASATSEQRHRQPQESKRLRFSNLINKILDQHDEDGPGINKALEIIMVLCKRAKDRNDKCYAFTWQVISRLLTYHVENSQVSPATAQELKSLMDGKSPSLEPMNGFDAAIMCIDQALEIKKNSTLLTTKGDILKHRLASEFRKAKSGYRCSAEDLLHATQLGRAACDVFEEARRACATNWYATDGDIETCLWLLHILKSADDLNEKYSSLNYLDFLQHKHLPRKLKYHLSEDGSLEFLLSMEMRINNLLDSFYAKEHVKTKMHGEEWHVDKWHDSLQLFQNRRAEFLDLVGGLPKFFKSDRASQQQRERAVHCVLQRTNERPYSSWYTLSEERLQEIIHYLKPLIKEQEVTNHRSMTCLVRACFECNTIPNYKDINLSQSLFAVISKWAEMSASIDGEHGKWAHLFNYMIHFPHDQAPEWANTNVVKDSLKLCVQSVDKQKRPLYFLTKKPMPSGFPLIPARCVGDGKNDPEFHSKSFWRIQSPAVSKQLKRVCGTKADIGWIQYQDLRLKFNNDFYPKQGTDKLYFYVGFLFRGPRAYDPVPEAQYKQWSKSQSLQSESKMSATQCSAEPFTSSPTSKAKSKVSVGRSSGNSGQTKQKFGRMEVTSPVADRRTKIYQQQSLASKANKASQIREQPLDDQVVGGDSSCDDNWQIVKGKKGKAGQSGGWQRPRASSGHPALVSPPHQELPGSYCPIPLSNSFSEQANLESELASANENPSNTRVDVLQPSNSVGKAGQGKSWKPRTHLFRELSRCFSDISDVHDLADELLKGIEQIDGRAWVKSRTGYGGVLDPKETARDVFDHWYKKLCDPPPDGERLYDVLHEILPRVAEEFKEKILAGGD